MEEPDNQFFTESLRSTRKRRCFRPTDITDWTKKSSTKPAWLTTTSLYNHDHEPTSDLDHELNGVHVWKESIPRHRDEARVVDREDVIGNWRRSGEHVDVVTPQQTQSLTRADRHVLWHDTHIHVPQSPPSTQHGTQFLLIFKLHSCIYTVSQEKGYHPTTNDNFNNSCWIPVIFWYKYYWVYVPSKGGLMYHITCLMYVPYLGKL